LVAPTQAELDFYATPGRMTDLSSIADHVADLPSDVPSLCKIVQLLVVHRFWDTRYGVTDAEERDDEMQIRPADEILAKVLEIDPRPLDHGRMPQQRVLGNCRDFTTVTVALLRDKGVPARGRCGFGAYFTPGLFEDHWVVEWWDGERWVFTDAQLDAFQVAALNVSFDPLDVPRDAFIDAGRAWAMYRSGEHAGEKFGLSGIGMAGPWFIRGNIWRDIASLNKVELLPWDGWGLDDLTEPMSDDETDTYAGVAARADFDEHRTFYETNDLVRVPDVINSYLPSGPVRVQL
jgi:hypothetical protein